MSQEKFRADSNCSSFAFENEFGIKTRYPFTSQGELVFGKTSFASYYRCQGETNGTKSIFGKIYKCKLRIRFTEFLEAIYNLYLHQGAPAALLT